MQSAIEPGGATAKDIPVAFLPVVPGKRQADIRFLEQELVSYTILMDDKERLFTTVGKTRVLCEDFNVDAFSNGD